MSRGPDWAAYAGYWVALVRGAIVAHGRTEREAFLAAKAARPREDPEVVYVSPAGAPMTKRIIESIEGDASQPERLPSSCCAEDAPGFDSLGFEVSPLVEHVAHILRELNASGYFVGGLVRDLFLQRRTRDLDIAVHSEPLALGQALADRLEGAYFPLDEERGVARVLFVWRGAEAHADVASIRGDDIVQDLWLRDFTVNALAVPLHELERDAVVDPTGGFADLEARVVRAVSEQSFAQDPARLLRAVRISQELGFRLDEATAQDMHSKAALLRNVSAERVRDELNLMLALPQAGQCVRLLDRFGFLTVVVPEVDPLRGLEQPRPHRWDAWEHSVRTLEAVDAVWEALANRTARTSLMRVGSALTGLRKEVLSYLSVELAPGQSRLAMLKWAALLHDVGKAATQHVSGDTITFYDHPRAGAPIAARVLNRLRYSGLAARMAALLVGEHMRFLSLMHAPRITRRALFRLHRALGDATPAACLLFLADAFATGLPGDAPQEWRRALAVANRVLRAYYREPGVMSPAPVVSGRDLMEALGVREGPVVGFLLGAIQEAQAEGRVRTREQALELAAKALRAWKGKTDADG